MLFVLISNDVSQPYGTSNGPAKTTDKKAFCERICGSSKGYSVASWVQITMSFLFSSVDQSPTLCRTMTRQGTTIRGVVASAQKVTRTIEIRATPLSSCLMAQQSQCESSRKREVKHTTTPRPSRLLRSGQRYCIGSWTIPLQRWS